MIHISFDSSFEHHNYNNNEKHHSPKIIVICRNVAELNFVYIPLNVQEVSFKMW
jgi:hypothetical protein